MDMHSKINKTIETPMSVEFFSQQNVDRIQVDLIEHIHVKTKHRISKQDEVQLLALMREVMNTYGEYGIDSLIRVSDSHLSVMAKVRKLNSKVVQLATENVEKSILSYMKYIRDASSLPVPIPRAQLSTSDNSFEMNKSFF